jgi:hypothetical protein
VVVGTVGICLLSYPKIAEMDTLTDVVVEGKKEKEEEREEDNALVTSVFPVCVCVCVCVEGGGEKQDLRDLEREIQRGLREGKP